jgi:uroporphyrinogen-III synthase
MSAMNLGPLAGYTIGITADRRWEEQAELLQRRGARVLHGPTIRTLALHDEDALSHAITALVTRAPDAVLLTTGLGTRGWFATAESLGAGEQLHATLSEARVYARGPKAAGAAITAGLEVVWKAPGSRACELVDQLLADRAAGLLSGTRVAVQLDGSSESWVQDQLTAAGFEVVPVPVYRWTIPNEPAPALRLIQGVADRSIDAVTFTAGPALANFFELAEAEGIDADVREAFNSDAVTAVCVGPVCGEKALRHGLVNVVEPQHPRLGAMVQACTASFAERTRSLRLGGHDVMVQGRFVVVGGDDPISLSDRERGVLDVLAERPGVVQSKATLLRAVWGGSESDEHVVEVTVGRLRQRLGSAGVGVETVVRRGYRLAAD